MKTSFPAIATRADYKRVSSYIRQMRSAARLYRISHDAEHLGYAVAIRSLLSAYRVI